jgi:SAM-dependent methyltransferase
MSHYHSQTFADNMGWGSKSLQLDPSKQKVLDLYTTGKTVVDLGCASGKYGNYLKRKAFLVYGLDHDQKFLQQANNNQPSTRYIRGDVTELPFKNKSIDTIIAFDILEHVAEKKLLMEMARVTVKRIIISVPHTTAPELLQHFLLYGHHQDRTHLRTYTESQLLEKIKSYGFNNIHIIPSHPISPEAIFMDLFSGSKTLKRLMRKLCLLVLRPKHYFTNLICIADMSEQPRQPTPHHTNISK